MRRPTLLLAVLALFATTWIAPTTKAMAAEEGSGTWPHRVLLTNDDGIGERRLHTLARAFSEHAETWVVASFADRSGTSNYTSLGKYQRTLLARREHVEDGLVLYGVSGYPADAVMLGVGGLLRDTPPDLVVSGVNGGPNLGVDGWWGSGTIGAARTAAFLGIPAIAVSGLDDDDAEMMARVNDWVIELAQSSLVRNLEPGQYLTVAIPQVPADQIRGIKIAPRAASALVYSIDQVRHEEDGDETEEIWVFSNTFDPSQLAAESDAALMHQGYIVVTPMRLGEVDGGALTSLRDGGNRLPEWTGP